jgi:cell division cycle 14
VVKLKVPADKVADMFSFLTPQLIAYRDASYGICSYKCTLRSCLRGLETALKARLFDPVLFDLRAYEFYEKVQNGDMNWIIPSRLLAFSTPNQNKKLPGGVSSPVSDVQRSGLHSHL